MALSLDALNIVIATLSRVKNALDLETTYSTIDRRDSYEFTDGAGANQADVHFSDQRTLAASATEDLDLAGGLTDAAGAAITFARIKAIIIKASSGNTNNVQVGGAAANAFVNWVADATDKLNIRPGGMLVLIANDATGYAVTAGTGDLLRIGNSGGVSGVTYDIILIGSLT